MSATIQIASTMFSILINVISSDVTNKKLTVKEKYSFYRFKKDNKKWIDEFCKKYDGTILTMGMFATYLTYQHPIDEIYQYVLCPSKDGVGNHTFINQITEESKSYFLKDGFALSAQNEGIIKELFKKIYTQLNEYCQKNMSVNERYGLATILNGQAKQTEILGNDIRGIKDYLKNAEEIRDPEIIGRVYTTLSKDVLSGYIDEIYNLMSLLEGKNEDINIAIRLKMSIISEYKCIDVDMIDALNQISSVTILDDVTRFLILYWIDNKDKLLNLQKYIKNDDLKKITVALINKEWECFLTLDIKKENHVNVMKYTVTEQYKYQNWLIRRICAYRLYKESVYNVYEAMNQLLEDDINFVDKIFIIEKKQEELLSITGPTNIDFIEWNRIKKQLQKLENNYIHANKQLQTKFYELLMRTLVVLNAEELEETMQKCPPDIKNYAKIKAFTIQDKIIKKIANEDEVVDFCLESDQYWLLNNYLIQYRNNTVELQNIIEKYPITLKKDICIFLMYIQAIYINQGKEKAIIVLDKYNLLYKNYLEYWIEYVKLFNLGDELIITLFDKWENEHLKEINMESERELIEILIGSRKYKEAYQVIKKIEALGKSSVVILRLKAKILLEQNQVINTMNILQRIFDDYSTDPFVVDTSIVLALNGQRDVTQKVIDAAVNIGTDRLLMLAAVVYARKKKYEEAIFYMTKALLRTNGNNIEIYGNYFMLNVKSEDGSERKIAGVEEDTAIFLQSNNGEKLVYCIYRDKVLPVEPYCWESATHIYRDTAIEIGLFRKKTNDVISINGIDCRIMEIMPVDCHLFRLCMKKLIEAKTVQQFSIEVQEDGNVNYDKLIEVLKVYTPKSENTLYWLDNYKDLSNMPLPFHILQRYVRVNDAQLIILFLQDPNIIIRELYNPPYVSGKQYILTFAATVMLYMLGVSIEHLNENKVVITSSLQNELVSKCIEIIDDNDKDTVSSIGVVQDSLFVNVASEEEKITTMREATGLKRYVSKFKTKENKCDFDDIDSNILNGINMIDTFGISDYDTLAIAKKEKYVAVTGEVTIMYFLQMEGVGAEGIGIINFLVEMKFDIEELLGYMLRMLEYKFLITLTDKSITYLIESYLKIEEDDKKERCMEKWIEYLAKPEDMGDEYKKIFVQVLIDVFKVTCEQQAVNMNPIWSNFTFFLIKYNHIRMQVLIGEDGKIEVVTHRKS